MRNALGQEILETNFDAKAQRRITSGRVLSVNELDRSVLLDVGAVDAQGRPLYRSVPYQPQNPPQPNDRVEIAYSNISPHSGTVGSSVLGGANADNVVEVRGAVSGLRADTNVYLQGQVSLLAGTDIQLNQVGQDIEIVSLAASAAVPDPATTVTDVGVSGAVGVADEYAREDHVHEGVHTIEGLTGDVTISAGTDIGINVVGNDIAIGYTGSGGGGSGNLIVDNHIVNYSSFASSSPFFIYNLTGVIPAGAVIVSSKLKHSVEWQGTGISTVNAAIYIYDYETGTDIYLCALDVDDPAAPSNLATSNVSFEAYHLLPQDLSVLITADNSTSGLTQGSLDIWIAYYIAL